MATISNDNTFEIASLSNKRRYRQFASHFSPAQRKKLIQEDVTAGTTVSLVLASVVLAGVIAMALTVLSTLP